MNELLASGQSLQKPHIVMTLASAAQWSLYGLLTGDSFLFASNAASSAVAAAQVALFYVFPENWREAGVIIAEK